MVAGKYGLPFMPCLSDLDSDLMNYVALAKQGCEGKMTRVIGSTPEYHPKNMQ